MKQNTKTCIEELKQIVMSLHRSASDLDAAIMKIEAEGLTLPPGEYRDLFIALMMEHRLMNKQILFNDLDTKEFDIWNRLTESLSEET